MEPSTQPGTLSEEEIVVLRRFVEENQDKRKQEWAFLCSVSLLVSVGFVGGQLLIRWLPPHLEARGLAVCLRHQTLHHGTLWLPHSYGFAELLKGPGAFGMLYAFYLGLVAYTSYHQHRQARRVARLVARLLPASPAA